jgi:uncharacterized membrane protein YbaN (DUF454 family)
MRWLLYALGWLFAALALLGLLLPLLPCTPFALLAATCFSYSSPAARRWLYQSRWLGPVLRDWRRHRGFRRATKYQLIAVAVAAALLTVVLARSTEATVASLLLTAVVIAVLAAFPTVDPNSTPPHQSGDAPGTVLAPRSNDGLREKPSDRK